MAVAATQTPSAAIGFLIRFEHKAIARIADREEVSGLRRIDLKQFPQSPNELVWGTCLKVPGLIPDSLHELLSCHNASSAFHKKLQ